MTTNKNLTPRLEDVIASGIVEALKNTHTTLIARVTQVNQTTINCQPVISTKYEDLPEFPDVPVVSLFGGSSSIQMPIAEGDYCILLVNERCFDLWYDGYDEQPPLLPRMHDYSDSVAIVGIQNKDGELDIPKVILITGDMKHEGDLEHIGDTTRTGGVKHEGNLERKGSTKLDGDLTQSGNSTITGNVKINGNLNISGNISVSGRITCSALIVGGTNFSTHVHGNGNNGTPTTTPM